MELKELKNCVTLTTNLNFELLYISERYKNICGIRILKSFCQKKNRQIEVRSALLSITLKDFFFEIHVQTCWDTWYDGMYSFIFDRE